MEKSTVQKYGYANTLIPVCVFLEIKQKDGKGNTNKSRVQIADFETTLSVEADKFITESTSAHYQLSPCMWNQFNRFTLVNPADKERVTVDLNLSYKNGETRKTYDKLVIIEVKQERFNRNSPIVKELKTLHINPYGFSKYCIGMITLYKNLKYNRFKRKILQINNCFFSPKQLEKTTTLTEK